IGGLCYLFTYVGMFQPAIEWLKNWPIPRTTYMLAALVIITLALSLRPIRFGLSVAALFIATTWFERNYDHYVYEGRGFFGLLRVKEARGDWEPMPQAHEHEDVPYEWKTVRRLIHGGINHGQQIVAYKDDRYVRHLLGTSAVGLGGMPNGYDSLLVNAG